MLNCFRNLVSAITACAKSICSFVKFRCQFYTFSICEMLCMMFVQSYLSVYYEYLVGTIRISCRYITNILSVHHEYLVGTLRISCRYITNILSIRHEYLIGSFISNFHCPLPSSFSNYRLCKCSLLRFRSTWLENLSTIAKDITGHFTDFSLARPTMFVNLCLFHPEGSAVLFLVCTVILIRPHSFQRNKIPTCLN